MRLLINGKPKEVGQVTTLQELVTVQHLSEGQVIIELNGRLIPRHQWGAVSLKPDDSLCGKMCAVRNMNRILQRKTVSLEK